MNKVALTGASGMLGSHLKALLKRKGVDCLEVTRESWDLTQWKRKEEFDLLFKDVKVIFHVAAYLPKQIHNETQIIFDANVRSCLNLCEWALERDIKIVYISGSTVYKDTTLKKISEDDEKTTFGLGGLYGYSKLLAEQVFMHYIPQGLKVAILRPTSIYGLKLGDDKLLNIFLDRASKNEKLILTQPNNRINLIHAMDVANACFQVYFHEIEGIFNIAAKNNPSIMEIANTVISLVGEGELAIDDDSSNFVRFDLDCSLAKESFGYEPKIDIKMGLEAMYNNDYLVEIF